MGNGKDPEIIDLTVLEDAVDMRCNKTTYAGMAKRPRISPPAPPFRTVSPDHGPPVLKAEVTSPRRKQLGIGDMLKLEHVTCSLPPPALSCQVPNVTEINANEAAQPSTSKGVMNPVSVAATLLLNEDPVDEEEEYFQPQMPLKKRVSFFSKVQELPNEPAKNTIPVEVRNKMVQALERTKNILKQTDDENKAKPPKPEGHRPRSKKIKTPAQLSILESKFRTNRDPKPSELFKIAEATQLSTAEVKTWFYQEKKKRGLIKPRKSKNTVNTSSLCGKDQIAKAEDNEVIVPPPQEPANDASDTPCYPAQADLKDEHKPARKNTPRRRYIRRIQDRTVDNVIVENDMTLVEQTPVEVVKEILDTVWEVKANRIYKLATKTDKTLVISREAKRLDHITYAQNPFSIEQDAAVDNWFDQYVDKLCKNPADEREKMELKQYVTTIIKPWLRPFVYSRIVQQDGRNLCLLVAIDDFCRISHDKDARNFKWEVPSWLQQDTIELWSD